MNKVNISMRNCYGIDQLDHEFDFSNSNAIAIYARNGLMKTSFAKGFRKIQDDKADEIRDEIFNIDGCATVECDGTPVSPEDIFVIKSFESSYQADVTPLLINSAIKERLKNVLKARDKLFKTLEKQSGLKIKKTQGGKIVYELEPQIIEDFDFEEDSFLVNLDFLYNTPPEQNFTNIKYSVIFDDSVIKKIKSNDFQEKIEAFLEKSEEIYSSYGFLEKGQFTLPKLKDVRKILEKDKFFVKGNLVSLGGIEQISDLDALNAKITEIDEQIKAVPQFKIIEQLLSDAKGMLLKDIIEETPEILPWLTTAQLSFLRKNLWLSYLEDDAELFGDLYEKYRLLSAEIEAVSLDDTPWKQALMIYKERFNVPYMMEITNLKGAIIGESIPRVEFSFEKDEQTVTLSRDKLDELDTLSQGEKRALYLLNIIFEIEEIKRSERETLFIIDDIADSFDYKNKYAIVEYIYELAENPKFKMVILSHNFDFYRTISSRLGLPRSCRLFAENSNGRIQLTEEFYQNQPFKKWKENPVSKNIIALIPFVRNLVEYGRDYKTTGTETDFDLLTTLLHEKENTHNMRFADLTEIYKTYLDLEAFDDSVNLQSKIIESLYSICEGLTTADTKLENKIILAMAIRHKAEEFMKREIRAFEGTLSWRENRRVVETGTSMRFLAAISSKGNQTRELLNGYKQFGDSDSCKILEEVNIMTPENIHLNSFMYEPILDMDIIELISLYSRVKQLLGGSN